MPRGGNGGAGLAWRGTGRPGKSDGGGRGGVLVWRSARARSHEERAVGSPAASRDRCCPRLRRRDIERGGVAPLECGRLAARRFTLAENLADLKQHEREHVERKAFTYTVLSPDEVRCLGCVYIQPVMPEAASLCGEAARAAAVGFWVRTSEIRHDLDRHLLAVLLEWLHVDWPFDCILFTNMAGETRQAALLGEIGLTRLPLTWCDGRSGSAFRVSR